MLGDPDAVAIELSQAEHLHACEGRPRDTWQDVKDKVEDIGDGAEDRLDERDETGGKVAEGSASAS
jgi:hypothetical protein